MFSVTLSREFSCRLKMTVTRENWTKEYIFYSILHASDSLLGLKFQLLLYDMAPLTFRRDIK